MTKCIEINKKDSYQSILRAVRPVKLLEFLYESLPDRSRKSIKSLLEQNQIWVHLQDVGHSIAGDKKYGAATDPLGRLGLHAGILEFFHPATGKCMHFETPVPAVLEKLFELSSFLFLSTFL